MTKNKDKTREARIEELEDELERMRKYHRSLWDDYGSELCAGEMLKKEKELEDRIKEF